MSDARRDIQSNFSSIWRRNIPTGAWSSRPTFPFPAPESAKITRLMKTIDANHSSIMGKRARRGRLWSGVPMPACSAGIGIETVNYGPSSGPRDAEGEKVEIKTLVDITKIYALDRRGIVRRGNRKRQRLRGDFAESEGNRTPLQKHPRRAWREKVSMR